MSIYPTVWQTTDDQMMAHFLLRLVLIKFHQLLA